MTCEDRLAARKKGRISRQPSHARREVRAHPKKELDETVPLLWSFIVVSQSARCKIFRVSLLLGGRAPRTRRRT